MRPIRLISYLLRPRSGQTGSRPMRGRAHIRVENNVVSLSTPPQRPPSSPVRDARPSEPNGVQTEAVDEIEMPLPSNPQTFFLGSLFTLAVLAAVYVASSIILPVVLAFVCSSFFNPRCVSWSVYICPEPWEHSWRSCSLLDRLWVL